jgi:hypothetical protein
VHPLPTVQPEDGGTVMSPVFTMWCTLIALYISRWLFCLRAFAQCMWQAVLLIYSLTACAAALLQAAYCVVSFSHDRWHSTLPLLSQWCCRGLSVTYCPAAHADLCTPPPVLLPCTCVQSISLQTMLPRMRCQRTTSRSCVVMWCRTMTWRCWQHSAPLQEHRCGASQLRLAAWCMCAALLV